MGEIGYAALESAGMHTLTSGPRVDWLGLEFGGEGWADDQAITERATTIINGLQLGIPFEIVNGTQARSLLDEETNSTS